MEGESSLKDALRVFMTALAAVLSLISSAGAQPIAEFYKSKTVSLVISSAPGGGYDLLARAIARHLPNHIPGTPTVVVRNMPGAGGIVATNYLFNNAPRDGTVIGGVQNNTPFEPLFGTKEAKYDPTKFIWLGTPSVETGILTVWHTAPADTLEDARKRELTVGSSGANSTPSFYARLLNETLGTKLKIILGYQSQTQTFLAMERGEVDGYPSVFYSALQAVRPNWLKEKKVKLLVQFGLEKEAELPDVPFALDLAANEDDRLLMEAAFAPLAAGRPYLLPPEVPEDRVRVIRTALMDTFRDPDFLAEAEKLSLGVNAPRSGEELQELLKRIDKTPAHLIERLRKLNNP